MKRRILVITKYEWDDRNAGGNTLSNFFKDWNDVEFFNIYCREALPNNDCCLSYFIVSPIDVAKHFLTPWRIGRRFIYNTEEIHERDSAVASESTLKRLSKKYQRLFEVAYDLLFSTMLWMNKNIKDYISNSRPDLVFAYGTPDVFNYQLIKYIYQNVRIPIVSYYVDDHYNNKTDRLDLLHLIRKRRLKRTAELSSKCYAISQQMCDEYARSFNKDFSLLYKGCVFNGNVINNIHTPIRIVYAGNLYYGRGDILAELADAISIINQERRKVFLDIYTSTELSPILNVKLNQTGVSAVHSPRPFEEIKRIMNGSDIVLHVESFDKVQINSVRLSFSTKITDCLQSGVKVVAIGPETIASMAFLKKIPGVTQINSEDQILPMFSIMVNQPECITEDASLTNNYARAFMSNDDTRRKLRKELDCLVSCES